MKFFLIVTIFVYSVYADELSLSNETIKAINDSASSWKAGNGFGELTSIDINSLISTLNESYHNDDFPEEKHNLYSSNFGEVFDARSIWPECPSIGKIYDQRKGVPSWVYATVGQIADRLCIRYGIQIDVEATVERMIKANGGFNSEYNSANIGQALKYWSNKGIFTVRSKNDTDCLPFSECETQVHIDKHFKVEVKRPVSAFDTMRDIMINGPLTVHMQVYSDLPYYQSGTYWHKTDKILGFHAVKVIGWTYSSGRRRWLVTNSWGTQWAEKGGYRPHLGSGEFGPDSDGFSALLSPMDYKVNCMDYTTPIPKQDQMFDLA